MTPSTPSSTTPDTRTPAVPTRTPDDFEARRVAWNARGGEHDRGIRDRLKRYHTLLARLQQEVQQDLIAVETMLGDQR